MEFRKVKTQNLASLHKTNSKPHNVDALGIAAVSPQRAMASEDYERKAISN